MVHLERTHRQQMTKWRQVPAPIFMKHCVLMGQGEAAQTVSGTQQESIRRTLVTPCGVNLSGVRQLWSLGKVIHLSAYVDFLSVDFT